MKNHNFKYICLLLFISQNINAQSSNIKRDTIIIHDTIYRTPIENYYDDNIHTEISTHTSRRDRRVHRYRDFWGALIPTNIKLQYAGGMGIFSIGTGWDYGKRVQWETDIMFGYVPKYSTKTTNLVFTLKQNYIPWSIYLVDNFDLEPLSCGCYFTTIFGDEFWNKEPVDYPKRYYGFSTKIRANIYIGQRLCYKIPESVNMVAKSATFFYEISSCDLHIISAITNSALKPKDYIKLSLGVKLQIF